MDGKTEIFVLSQWLDMRQHLQPDAIRAGSMQMHNPIHGFLFNSNGRLIHANLQAAHGLRSRGDPADQADTVPWPCTACSWGQPQAHDAYAVTFIATHHVLTGALHHLITAVFLAGMLEIDNIHLEDLLLKNGKPCIYRPQS